MFSIFLLTFLIFCSGTQIIDASIDFRTLGCTQRRNVTIVADLLNGDAVDVFLNYHLLEIAENHPCYLVNIYLPREDRVIRWDKDTTTHIKRQNIDEDYYINYNVEERILKMIQRI